MMGESLVPQIPEQSLGALRHDMATYFDIKKREILILLVIGLSSNYSLVGEDLPPYVKRLAHLMQAPLDRTVLERISDRFRKKPFDVLAQFPQVKEQSVLLEALEYCLTSDTISGKQENLIIYENARRHIDVGLLFRELANFYYNKSATRCRAIEKPVNPENIFKELLPYHKGTFNLAEIVSLSYTGIWQEGVASAEGQFNAIRTRAKSERKYEDSQFVYMPIGLGYNKVLDDLSEDIRFAKLLGEDDVYVVLGVVGKVSFLETQAGQAKDMKKLKDLVGRVGITLKKEHFHSYIAMNKDVLLQKILGAGVAKIVYYEALTQLMELPQIQDKGHSFLQKIADQTRLEPEELLLLHTRSYLNLGLKRMEAAPGLGVRFLEVLNQDLEAWESLHESLGDVSRMEMLQTAKDLFERWEPLSVPAHASPKVRVAFFSLVGNALRRNPSFGEREQDFLRQLTHDLHLNNEQFAAFPFLMKQARLSELVEILRGWSDEQKTASCLPAVAHTVVRAMSSDGKIDAQEEKYRQALFRLLELSDERYARLLLRIQLDRRIQTLDKTAKSA